jgi:hypothetical protein
LPHSREEFAHLILLLLDEVTGGEGQLRRSVRHGLPRGRSKRESCVIQSKALASALLIAARIVYPRNTKHAGNGAPRVKYRGGCAHIFLACPPLRSKPAASASFLLCTPGGQNARPCQVSHADTPSRCHMPRHTRPRLPEALHAFGGGAAALHRQHYNAWAPQARICCHALEAASDAKSLVPTFVFVRRGGTTRVATLAHERELQNKRRAPVCEIHGLHGTSSGHLQCHKCGESGHRRRTAGADHHTHLWPRAREQCSIFARSRSRSSDATQRYWAFVVSFYINAREPRTRAKKNLRRPLVLSCWTICR